MMRSSPTPPRSQVGEGGFGKVYRAMLRTQPVAVKVMAADGLQGDAQVRQPRTAQLRTCALRAACLREALASAAC